LWELVTVTALQFSFPTGGVQVTTASHDAAIATAWMSVPMQPVNVGFVLSWTTTLNEHVVILPAASFAV
jgi:hypothetical protein